jgi:hypothetical protein
MRVSATVLTTAAPLVLLLFAPAEHLKTSAARPYVKNLQKLLIKSAKRAL